MTNGYVCSCGLDCHDENGLENHLFKVYKSNKGKPKSESTNKDHWWSQLNS